MKTLQEAINQMNKGAGDSLRKHLNSAGVTGWEDITRESLYGFRDTICDNLAPSTAKTVSAYLRALLNRYQDSVTLPKDWEKILAVKGCKPVKTFLTPKELKAFENYKTKKISERLVQVECLVEAYTGARVSDVVELTDENFKDGYMTYTSKKTKTTATVPASEKVRGWVNYIQRYKAHEPGMSTRERIIRRIAKGAGINEPVVVFKAGKQERGPKWMFCTSHSMRISFCTNLQIAGIDLLSISRMAGHAGMTMTERYCAPSAPRLNEGALAYFNV